MANLHFSHGKFWKQTCIVSRVKDTLSWSSTALCTWVEFARFRTIFGKSNFDFVFFKLGVEYQQVCIGVLLLRVIRHWVVKLDVQMLGGLRLLGFPLNFLFDEWKELFLVFLYSWWHTGSAAVFQLIYSLW